MWLNLNRTVLFFLSTDAIRLIWQDKEEGKARSPAQRQWRRWRWWWRWERGAWSHCWTAGTPVRTRWRPSAHHRQQWTGPFWLTSRCGTYWWCAWGRSRLWRQRRRQSALRVDPVKNIKVDGFCLTNPELWTPDRETRWKWQKSSSRREGRPRWRRPGRWRSGSRSRCSTSLGSIWWLCTTCARCWPPRTAAWPRHMQWAWLRGQRGQWRELTWGKK